MISFNHEMQEQVESLASQGAVALTNKRLVEELKTLFEAFIKQSLRLLIKNQSILVGIVNVYL